MPADLAVWVYIYGSIVTGIAGMEILWWVRRRTARREARDEQ